MYRSEYFRSNYSIEFSKNQNIIYFDEDPTLRDEYFAYLHFFEFLYTDTVYHFTKSTNYNTEEIYQLVQKL